MTECGFGPLGDSCRLPAGHMSQHRDRPDHELLYRAGSSGFASIGIPDVSTPHWYCSCGGWRKDRNYRGSPMRETAQKHHRKHVQEAAQ